MAQGLLRDQAASLSSANQGLKRPWVWAASVDSTPTLGAHLIASQSLGAEIGAIWSEGQPTSAWARL